MSSTPTNTFSVYGTLFKIDARYQFIAALGRGSYGIVCSAKDLTTGDKVAIKRVSPMARKTSDAKHTLREICLMQCLGNHPNIISIRDMCVNVTDDELYIIMDYMDTDMHRVIQSSQLLSDSHHRYFMHQVLRGVKHIHDNGFLHRDLKPGNILVTKSCQLKIADFGLARSFKKYSDKRKTRPVSAGATKQSTESALDADWQPMTEHVVTRWYRAPELMLQPDGHYSTGVDMWSIGCIFAEMLGRKALFPGKNFIHQLTLIFDVIGTPSANDVKKMKSTQAQRFVKSLGKKPKVPFRNIFPVASLEAIDLLERMLHFDPANRCTIDEALSHPYMQSIEKRYTLKEVIVPTHISFSFEHQNLSKNELVKLIVAQVDGFARTTTSEPPQQSVTGIRAIHSMAKQNESKGRVTLENPSAARVRPGTVAPVAKPSQLLTTPSIVASEATTIKPRPSSSFPTKAPPVEAFVPSRTTLVCKEETPATTSVKPGSVHPTASALLEETKKPVGPAESSSSSEDEAPAIISRPKSAPVRGGKGLKNAPTCVGSTSSLIRAQRATQTATQTVQPTQTTQAKPAPKHTPLTRSESYQDISEDPKVAKGKKLTVPVSPKFSVMSWQKQKKQSTISRPATALRSKKLR
ncbi:mitogen-activated protein kinase [Thraustotheca clavata]|uniref:Mitogen-activated protein kinase n=1 Tax=Thraustotheca clavata TaxID=74557 RepID=A0A1V9ZZI7_9STRA|nr:mitogen-activated protein kinase [Thraustotheca clavata]